MYDDFKHRVDLAARYISQGRRTTRTFDSCFENCDGDAVVVALYRRTQKRPDTKLAQNLWRYISKSTVMPEVEKYSHISDSDLQNLAAQLRQPAEPVT